LKDGIDDGSEAKESSLARLLVLNRFIVGQREKPPGERGLKYVRVEEETVTPGHIPASMELLLLSVGERVRRRF